MDAAEPAVVADFWAAALGLRAERRDDGDAVLRGSAAEQTVWVDRVPEPKTVKNRVHLDLVCPDVQPLLDLGARTLQHVEHAGYRWVVLADPEGNELCAFDRGPSALVVDSPDPVDAARWWADVLGARIAPDPDGTPRWLDHVPGLPFDVVKFVGVADPRTVKNRVHWDVVGDDVSGLVASGARLLRRPEDEVRWHVLADAEGNEFCVFSP